LREPVLEETLNSLTKTYINKTRFHSFIQKLIVNPELAGNSPSTFWRNVNVLDIQLGGQSQTEIRSILDHELNQSLGFGLEETGRKDTDYIYLDDGIFSGNRVRRDIEQWLISTSPDKCTIDIVVMALHSSGQFYARTKIEEKAKELNKSVTLRWWRIMELEDRRYKINESDVLRPTSIGTTKAAKEYEAKLTALGYPPLLRTVTTPPYESDYFSSESGRSMLEGVFLESGLSVLTQCSNLPDKIRPLGFSALHTLGFGSLYVTFRNCPNTCPTVFWVDSPWYPLFPRKTN
jgi:hypothetical protein